MVVFYVYYTDSDYLYQMFRVASLVNTMRMQGTACAWMRDTRRRLID
jgi:hypothetical protein